MARGHHPIAASQNDAKKNSHYEDGCLVSAFHSGNVLNSESPRYSTLFRSLRPELTGSPFRRSIDRSNIYPQIQRIKWRVALYGGWAHHDHGRCAAVDLAESAIVGG